MAEVLVLFAHPAYEKSRVQRTLLEAIEGLPGVTFHDLYQRYPDFDVDPRHEQKLLLEHQTILFQHPFYWYSVPALLKQWMDLVLEHGFAYGDGGIALRGRRLVSVISTGGGRAAYSPEGFHETTVAELLAPIRQTARLCKLEYGAPYVVHGAFQLGTESLALEGRLYAQFVTELVNGTFPWERAAALSNLRDWRQA